MVKPEDAEVHALAAASAAAMYGGVVSRLSAAICWRWDVLSLPVRPQITLPRNRRLKGIDRSAVDVRRMDLPDKDFDESSPVTTPRRTLVDCGRYLPFPQAFCVFNSAVRGGFSSTELVEMAASARGPGSVALRRVVSMCDPRPDNGFESALWAICLGIPGLRVEPQVPVGGDEWIGTPDLVDLQLGIVIEADSFAWHGSRSGLVRDARRYNAFAAAGWLVLRFTWEDVMLRRDQTRAAIESAVRLRTERL